MNDYEEQNTTGSAEGKPAVTLENVIKGFLDHQANSVREAGRAVDALLPEDFKKHGKNSLKEGLKSYQVLFDAGLDVLNRAGKSVDEALKRAQDNLKENDARASSTGTNKVRVEVE